MAVEPLQYFISFAYIDDEKPLNEEQGWVTHFVDSLAKEFAKRTGEKQGVGFTHFFSPENQDNAPINDFLLKNIEKSQIFVALVSPSFMASSRCRQEVDAFAKIHAKKSDFSDRVFVARLYPDWYDNDKIPKCFIEKRRFEFWYNDEHKRARRMCDPVPNRKLEDWEKYNQGIQDLAMDMKVVAKRYWNAPPPPLVRGSVGAFSKPRGEAVFVDGGPEDRDLIDRTARALRSLGYSKVLLSASDRSSSEMPIPAGDFDNNMSRCDTVVLLRKHAPGHLVSRRITSALKKFATRDAPAERPKGYGRVIVVDTADVMDVANPQTATVLHKPNYSPDRCAKAVLEELK